jgi:hypothetical protein
MYVLSWFNRRKKKSRSQLQLPFNVARSTTNTKSGDYVEIHQELKNYFLIWDKQLVSFTASGTMFMNACGVSTSIAFDSGANELENGCGKMAIGGYNFYVPVGLAGTKTGLVEGSHYGTLVGCRLTPFGQENTTDTGVGPWSGWRTDVASNTKGIACPLSLTLVVDG